MGDLQIFSDRANGVVYPEERFPLITQTVFPPSPPPLPPLNPDPSVIDKESWAVAEETIQQIMRTIQPTSHSEQKRRDVIDYLQRLLGCSLSCEVVAYGSVPLKTYLPDGDIDLTALSSPNAEDTLICQVFDVLRKEELNDEAEFEVKDVQLISAEVKLVKCIVQGIIVDISCNQLGGLCTLCFLEQVDHLVSQSHLFKCSIILIKAWCYYESRILGATHGLISTYALEVLVLYIFHTFHSSLNGPLSVLYRFLDYFSKFDWDNYCVSLQGPVCKSSLPDMIVGSPDVEGDNVLLSEEFIRNCMNLFSIQSKGIAKQSRPFPLKFMNIIDPLRDNNNLGRSVNKGNFYRIRSAFKFGARKLGWILLLPREKIAEELKDFYTNTMVIHGAKKEMSLEVPSLSYSLVGSAVLPSSFRSEIVGTCGWSSEGIDAAFLMGNTPPSARNSYCSFLSLDASQTEKKNFDQNGQRNSLTTKKTGVGISIEPDGNNPFSFQHNNHRDDPCNGLAELGDNPIRMVSLRNQNGDISCFAMKGESLNSVADLAGDYDSHVQSLLYGQCCCSYAIARPDMHFRPPFPSKLRNKKSWDSSSRSGDTWKNFYRTTNVKGVWAGSFTASRGTGTYIPRLTCGSQNRKLSPGRGGNQTLEFSPEKNRHAANNHDFAGAVQKEPSFYREGRYEACHPYCTQDPVVEVDSKKSGEHDSDFCVDAEKLVTCECDNICVDSRKFISPSEPDNIHVGSKKFVISPSEPDNICVDSKKSVISPSEPAYVHADSKKFIVPPSEPAIIHVGSKTSVVVPPSEPDKNHVDPKTSVVVSPSEPVCLETKTSFLPPSESDSVWVGTKTLVAPPSEPHSIRVDSKTSTVVPPSEPDTIHVDTLKTSAVMPLSEPSNIRGNSAPYIPKESDFPPLRGFSTQSSAPCPRKKAEFRSVVSVSPSGVLVREENKQQTDESCSLGGASGSNAEAPAAISSGAVQGSSDDRVVGEKAYFLKDEDFPPLSRKEAF